MKNAFFLITLFFSLNSFGAVELDPKSGHDTFSVTSPESDVLFENVGCADDFKCEYSSFGFSPGYQCRMGILDQPLTTLFDDKAEALYGIYNQAEKQYFEINRLSASMGDVARAKVKCDSRAHCKLQFEPAGGAAVMRSEPSICQ